jgi:hypothetical protein
MLNSGPIVKYGFMDYRDEQRLILWDFGVYMYLFSTMAEG